MNRARNSVAVCTLFALLASLPLSTGCILGPNVSVNLVVPLGLGGTPGLLNPFGLVQAFINSLIAPPTTDEGGSSTGAPQSTPPTLDPTIPVVIGGGTNPNP